MIPFGGIPTVLALPRQTPKSGRRNASIRLRAAMRMNEERIAIRMKQIGGTDGGRVGGKLREDGKSLRQCGN